MISISEMRTYFDERIKAVDSNYNFTDDPFGDDVVNENYGDAKYKLWFGALLQERLANTYSQTIPATLEVYSEELRDNTAAFDSVYEKALSFAEAICDPECLDPVNVTDIQLESATPEPLTDNDKMIKMVLSFNILYEYKYQQ